MTKEMLLEKSLSDLREIAKLQGVKSVTKYRKNELVDLIMNGGKEPAEASAPETPAMEAPAAIPGAAP
ncbi:MAG: Rho termination factor N-terminal domain-containing protein, partial [Clostridia bacterium]|nr:Rho termination factor N-terminal domain-containing protein [Clostridia bacterium]